MCIVCVRMLFDLYRLPARWPLVQQPDLNCLKQAFLMQNYLLQCCSPHFGDSSLRFYAGNLWARLYATIVVVVVVVVADIYPPVTGQRQTLTYWTIRKLFNTTTTLWLEESTPN